MDARAEREKNTYNTGQIRRVYDDILQHSSYFWRKEEKKILDTFFKNKLDMRVLELGSSSWNYWLEANQIILSDLHCINISEIELEKGKQARAKSLTKPTFQVMDAHDLNFPEHSFDIIFGHAILHHLNLPKVMDELNNKLKKNGEIIFLEPLNINPISKLVRWLTPQARTIDEIPFGFSELAILRKNFNIKIYPQQLFSVPFGVLSGILFKDADNWFNYLGYKLDQYLLRILPCSGHLFRHFIVTGHPK